MKVNDRIRIVCPDLIMDRCWQKLGTILEFDGLMYRVEVEGLEDDVVYKEGYFYEDELEELDEKS